MANQEPQVERARGRRTEVRREVAWPPLPLAEWRDTYRTLHLYMQIVGKVRLALSRKMNQWWNVPFYLNARGLTTSPIPYGDRTFEIDFDFIDHEVLVKDSDGHARAVALVSKTVSDFYAELFAVLRSLDIHVCIRPVPVEIPWVTPFPDDIMNRSYDAEQVNRFWRVLRSIEPVFEEFRARFRGKCSPVHLFWGSFDLAVTRFSGRRAPLREGVSVIERDAYDEEVFSLGFWPGEAWASRALTDVVDASFYAYMVPEPPAFAKELITPAAAYYSPRLKELLLPYELTRVAPDPRQMILELAESAYDAGSTLAGWDRDALAYP